MLRNLVLICAFLFSTTFGWGQISSQRNLPNYDNKPYHFGFYLGINYMDFQIRHTENINDLENYISAITQTVPGYHVGIISELSLGKYAGLRVNPTFSTTVRRITFDAYSRNINRRDLHVRDIESSFIEIPIEFKLKSFRIDNYRMYLLVGVRYNIDLASNEKVFDQELVKIKFNDFAYEFGVGFDIYFEYFKMSPQIKGSWGFSDILVRDDGLWPQGIDKLLTRGILFAITFE
ncbi:MAG: PorT family protein [Cryomorphaceae bacterium]|nr:PorT family protein [Cryomorphaceae bacterium]